jgi:uncharacterized protein
VIALFVALAGIAWVGHAGLWTAVLNRLYGLPLNKTFLKLWRWFTGFVILAFPLLVWSIDFRIQPDGKPLLSGWNLGAILYALLCFQFGAIGIPYITFERLTRPKPSALSSNRHTTHDFWPTLGAACRGDGKNRLLTHLPYNGVFRLDVTEVSLKLPKLPPKLDGLSVLVLSDFHLHGTPSRQWFDAVFDELAKLPTPDVLALVGDYVDTDTHHEWLAPLLGKLVWNECGLAILGNHDKHHQPDRVRTVLSDLGYTVVSNRWQEVTIRGERVIVVGHEGPWIKPEPNLKDVPSGPFRLCLSHTPDHFPWAADYGIDLTFSGHTHGGGIRIPVIGSIFVPCTSGRKYDTGVFERGQSVLVVGRGLSGKEPIRFRCNPQVLRLVLHPSG